MKIINKINGEVIAEIITNHSMTIEEALELVGERFETDDPSFDDPDFIVDGEEVWVEDCEMEWEICGCGRKTVLVLVIFL